MQAFTDSATLSWGDEDAAFTQDLSDYLSADKITLVGNG